MIKMKSGPTLGNFCNIVQHNLTALCMLYKDIVVTHIGYESYHNSSNTNVRICLHHNEQRLGGLMYCALFMDWDIDACIYSVYFQLALT